MAKNRMINTRFWLDTHIHSLPPTDKLLFLYFLTNEHTQICGVYELPEAIILIETGLNKQQYVAAMSRFAEDGKIFYIDGFVYIKNFQKHQSTQSERVQIGIDRSLAELPQRIRDLIEGIHTLSIPYAYPMGKVSCIPTPTPTPTPTLTPTGNSIGSINKRFELFWKEYPRKVAKPVAKKAWLKIQPGKVLSRRIIDSIESFKNTEDWRKDRGKFIPHPATFLNQERWNDELPEPKDNKPIILKA